MRFSGTPLEVRLGSTAAESPLLSVQGWVNAFGPLETRTNTLLAERTRRMTSGGIQVLNAAKQKFRTYAFEEPVTGCPALGNLALSWGDIFEQAKANLAALAALKPVRYCGWDLVQRWCRAIQWNVLLLRDATNVRPVFLFPNDTNSPDPSNSLAAVRRSSVTTLRSNIDDERGFIEGVPYPCGTEYGCGAPLAVQALKTMPALITASAVPLPWSGWNEASAGSVWWTALDQLPPAGAIDDAWMNAFPGRFSFLWGGRVGPSPGAFIDAKGSTYFPGVQAPGVSLPADRVLTAYWRTLQPVSTYLAIPNGRAEVFVNPQNFIDYYAANAVAFSRLNLGSILADSIGFYLLNHVVYWKNRGVLTLDADELASMQNALLQSRLSENLGLATGAIRTVAGFVNPIGGAIAGALTQIGFDLLVTIIGGFLEESGPRSLFIRNYPSSCAGLEGGDLLTEEERIRRDVTARAAAEAAAAERDGLAERIAANARASQEGRPPWLWIGGGIAAAAGLVLLLRR